MARRAALKPRPEWFTRFFDTAYVAQLREEKSPTDTRTEVEFLVRRLGLPGARGSSMCRAATVVTRRRWPVAASRSWASISRGP
jgi:hypothetical protein